MNLELRGVTKRFGSFVANDAIDLVLAEGEVHCLLGENGAGKSTLMNMLFGLLRPDAGQILIDGEPVDITGPDDATVRGIGMVHQHFKLVPNFTVAENVTLGYESLGPLWSLDRDEARDRVRTIAQKFGFGLDPDAVVEDLPIGAQQRVEIVKALSREVRVLILDEPTAVLTPQETDELMEILRQLKAGGTAIVFISHKLREVRAIADRITVIRQGRVMGQAPVTATNEELAELMVGRSVQLTVSKEHRVHDAVALRVTDLTLPGPPGHGHVLDGIDLDIHEGEILAVAGVQGNGQTELVEAIMGLRGGCTGSVRLKGHELLGRSTREVLDRGVGFVPEDRQSDGLVGDFSIAENLMLDRSARGPFARRGIIRRGALAAFAEQAIEEFDIRTRSAGTAAGRLSGGNQQKVVLAREFGRDLELFIASQPTRGIDVGSIEFVHRRIVAARDSGVAVLIVSSELDEVIALGDRIAVMYGGRIVGVVPATT
ncbi:ABC transporter ATP-binding protein, partial [Streptomyces sp. NPDC059477]|uniref:ABC transporter ATP-binding protein n=1 Tax=Streptomyces sp. NPDC059477 TaxID=3346847 RepID=UPI0036758AFD